MAPTGAAARRRERHEGHFDCYLQHLETGWCEAGGRRPKVHFDEGHFDCYLQHLGPVSATGRRRQRAEGHFDCYLQHFEAVKLQRKRALIG